MAFEYEVSAEEYAQFIDTEFLKMLPECNADDDGECVACEKYGACQDWVLEAAIDTSVSAEWLAREVVEGRFNSDTSMAEIMVVYEERAASGEPAQRFAICDNCSRQIPLTGETEEQANTEFDKLGWMYIDGEWWCSDCF